MAAVADIYPELEDYNATAVAISTDSVYSHKIFHDTSPRAHRVQFPLLSDRNGKISRDYGVWGPSTGAAFRATFIIDQIGRIRYYSVYPREVGRNVNEVVRTLLGIQYGETTGEGVPAYWRPGMSGIPRDFAKVGQY